MEKMNLWERYAQFYEFGLSGRVDVETTNEVFGTAWNGSIFWTFVVPHVAGLAVVIGCAVLAVRMVF